MIRKRYENLRAETMSEYLLSQGREVDLIQCDEESEEYEFSSDEESDSGMQLDKHLKSPNSQHSKDKNSSKVV